MRRAVSWTLADVIDFEHFLTPESSGRGDAALADRELFERKIAPRLSPTEITQRPAVFRAWLEARREGTPRPTPGECFTAGWQTLLALGLLGGLLLGGSVAGTLLAYPDPEPINAPLFFACTAGVQMALLLAGLLAWLGRRWLGSVFGDFAPLRAVLGALLAAMGAALRRLPGERRDRVREALGVLDRRQEIYGALAQWPLLLITQLFAVAFNVAILATTLAIHLPFVELRFGWQSTYQLSPERMHGIVATVAAPWKWAVPGAHPTAAEVAASRYTHGQSAQSLPPDAARAWWPFLAWSVAIYGLLPRAVLLVLAATKLRRGLGSLRFDHAEANALWRRLTGPIVTARGGEAVLSDGAPAAAPSRAVPSVTAGECLAFVAQELALDEAALRGVLAERFGWQLRVAHPTPIDSRREAEPLLAELRAAASSLAGVAVVIPAERDPIVAIALFLREVEAAAGASAEVLVLLTGAPLAGGFAAVDDERFGIWQRFKNIQRLRVGIERWPSE